VNAGDIYWVELPPVNGREQAGRRPAIVVQDDTYGGSLPVVLMVPLTTSLLALRFQGTVRIDPSPEIGLSASSVALVFQLRAVDRRRTRTAIGKVSGQGLEEIYTIIDKLIGRI
jgi:mRNA interferase MazF